MFDIRRQGNPAEIARQIRDIPAKVIPYAASSALTAAAKEASRRIKEEMPRVFDRPTPYALNALRVVPSTAQTLTARVAVKDQVGGNGIAPELFLLPEVEGGQRNEKRYEKALRFAGVLRAGERTVIGSEAPLDAFGNIPAGTIRAILAVVGVLNKNGAAQKKGKLRGKAYFAGPVGKKGTRGIWLRDGRTVKPILIFTTTAPSYRRRLDFYGTAEKAVRDVYEAEFNKAAEALLRKLGR